jgi:hypothetical protein
MSPALLDSPWIWITSPSNDPIILASNSEIPTTQLLRARESEPKLMRALNFALCFFTFYK